MTGTRSSAGAASAAPDTRERILEAALGTFAEKGFDGASTREIAGRAGVQLGLLRYYFGSKQKLWQAAVDRAFGDINRELDEAATQALDAEDELARTRAGIRAHVRFVARHPEFVRLMHDEGKRRGPRMRWMVDRHVKPLFDEIVPMVELAQTEGLLPSGIDATHFIYILAGSVGIFFHQAEECKRVAGIDPFDPAVVEDHARAVEFVFLGDSKQENKE